MFFNTLLKEKKHALFLLSTGNYIHLFIKQIYSLGIYHVPLHYTSLEGAGVNFKK